MRRRKHHAAFAKARNVKLTKSFLDERSKHSLDRGYTKQKWIMFSETLLDAGFTISLYEARKTWSKYLTISDGDRSFKVRFSNHKPIKAKELSGDCDFFVGFTHTGRRTTADALKAVEEYFGIDIRNRDGNAA